MKTRSQLKALMYRSGKYLPIYRMPVGTVLLHATCSDDANDFSGFFSFDTPADILFVLAWKMHTCGDNVRMITYQTTREQRLVLLGGKLTPEDLCRRLNIECSSAYGLWDNYKTRDRLCEQGYDGWIQSLISEPTRKKGREVLLCNRSDVKQVRVESVWDYMQRTRDRWVDLFGDDVVDGVIKSEDIGFLKTMASLEIPWPHLLSHSASLDVRTRTGHKDPRA